MKAVVLAAGRGERLNPYTSYIPKPLINLRGLPLIGHVISTLAKAGLDDILVVTGYRNEVIDSRIAKLASGDCVVRPIHNPNWQLGNATSLLAVKQEVERDDTFLLSMSDHIHDRSLIDKALADYSGENTLCIDRSPKYLADVTESTKVCLDIDGRVTQIGKELKRWDAIDTGIFMLRGDVFNAIPRGVAQLSNCMKALASSFLLFSCDVSGAPWLDIDTLDDLDHARRVVHWL